MHDISDLDRQGIPGVLAASTPFVDAAKTQSDALGFDARRVFVPHPIQDRTDAEMFALADAAVDALVQALLSP